MEKDERLLPLPNVGDLQPATANEPTAYSPMYDEEFDEKRSLREYFNVVYKRLPIILALTILTTAVVAFYMYRQPSIYEAHTGMIIEQRKQKMQSKDAININFGGDLNYYNTQLKLLQNPELMREVVISLNLQRDPNLFNGQSRSFLSTFRAMISSDKENQNKEPSLPALTDADADKSDAGQIILSPEEKDRAERYAGILLGGLRVEQVERTNLISVSVQSTNPDLAAKAADMVGVVFIRQDTERQTEGGKKSLEDLTKSIEDLKGTIFSQERELITEQSNSGLALFGGKGSDLNATQLQTLSGQLLAAKDERRKIEGDYAAAQRANASGEIFSVLGNDQAVQAMRAGIAARKAKMEDRIQEYGRQIQELAARKSQLLVRYTEEYKDVVAVNEEIKKREDILKKAELENSRITEQEEEKVKKDVAKEVLTGKRAQLEASQKREKQLEDAFNQMVSSANKKGIFETRLTTLSREVETNRGLLDTYIQRQKELELTISSSKPDNITISSHAVKPSVPIGPNRNRNIFLALLMSLAAGIGLAFLMDYLDDSIKTSDDIGRHLGLPTLALIPHTGGSDNKRRLASISGANGNGSDPASTTLMTIQDNRSALAEAYRHLRTSLLFSSAGKPPQTILVTSAQPSEGKTTTAINTAVTLAQSGAEVVIIDCDLRRPRLHKHFGVANSVGLTSYLSGEKNPDSLVKTCQSLPNLKVITSGPIPPNPAELLSSHEMKNLLQFLKGNFKHIIIDSPPASFFTDAAVLSMVVDGVVLVALAGKSSIYLTRRFKQRLGSIGARIYGVVLNGIKTNSLEYSYYGYGYTESYYAPGDDDDSTPIMEDDIIFNINDDKKRTEDSKQRQ